MATNGSARQGAQAAFRRRKGLGMSTTMPSSRVFAIVSSAPQLADSSFDLTAQLGTDPSERLASCFDRDALPLLQRGRDVRGDPTIPRRSSVMPVTISRC
jgi:hypothetical protein